MRQLIVVQLLLISAHYLLLQRFGDKLAAAYLSLAAGRGTIEQQVEWGIYRVAAVDAVDVGQHPREVDQRAQYHLVFALGIVHAVEHRQEKITPILLVNLV